MNWRRDIAEGGVQAAHGHDKPRAAPALRKSVMGVLPMYEQSDGIRV
jgi:hypothetical protein